jgi:hypothetical protein
MDWNGTEKCDDLWFDIIKLNGVTCFRIVHGEVKKTVSSFIGWVVRNHDVWFVFKGLGVCCYKFDLTWFDVMSYWGCFWCVARWWFVGTYGRNVILWQCVNFSESSFAGVSCKMLWSAVAVFPMTVGYRLCRIICWRAYCGENCVMVVVCVAF